MSRGLSAEMIAALEARTVRLEYFYSGVFDTQTVRYWTGYDSFVWGGNTYLGGGKFQGLSSIKESLNSSSYGIVVTLSGVSTEIIYLALNGCRQSNSGTVDLVLFDSNDTPIDSIKIFSGTLDRTILERSSTSGAVTLAYESRLIRFDEQREIRLTNELQQEKYSGDKGFEYVNQLKGARIYWGRADPGRLRL